MSRVFFYVQHLFGIGHLRRAAVVARAMAQAGLEVDLVSGGMPLPGLDCGGARLHQLPPLRTADVTFTRLVTESGEEASESFKTSRRDRLLALFESLSPEVLLTEQFPFGRRQLRFELEPLIAAAEAARPRPLILSSLRDVLVESRKPGKSEWMRDFALAHYDGVIVHGDPALVPLEGSFPHAGEIAGLLRYSGYVLPPLPAEDGGRDGEGEVIVSIGGGAFGRHLAELALAARPLSPLAGTPWRLLIGHNLPQEAFEGLRRAAGEGVKVERARPDFELLLRRCRLSISQGGYNTALEVLRAGPRAVIVPYAERGETEQLFRARLLSRAGAVTVVEEEGLGPRRLAEGIAEALSRPRVNLSVKDDGAGETARIILAMLAAR